LELRPIVSFGSLASETALVCQFLPFDLCATSVGPDLKTWECRQDSILLGMTETKDVVRWWERPMAPGPLITELGAQTTVLLPGVLGAIFAWTWWVTLVLMMPGIVLVQRLGWGWARARGLRTRSETPHISTAVGAIVGGICGVSVSLLPTRYLGLVAACLGIAGSAVVRILWRARNRRDGMDRQPV
jgi:hypothetical protein